MNTLKRAGLNLRGIGWFLAIAFGLNWLLALPLWLDGQGMVSPWAMPAISLMNFTPMLATLIVIRWISPVPGARRATGLRFGVRGSRWGLYWLFGLLGITAFNVAVPFIAAAFGLVSLDLAHFSGYREMLDNVTGVQGWLAMAPIQTLAMWAILTLPFWSLLNLPFNFGEEWGWRGYLLPQLLPLGQWRALLISGPIWGLWHAPIILLGFDYPQHHFLGVLCIMITCTLMGIILGWTRLATGSVWPAVLGHAAFDGSAAAYGIMSTAGVTYDTVLVGPIGLTGWIVPLLFILLLGLARRLPVRNPPDLAPPPEPVAAPTAAAVATGA